MPSTSSFWAAAVAVVAVADGGAPEAVADGGASVTVVVAEASPAAGDVWSAEAGAPSDLVVPDVADTRALSRYWMLRTFSPVEPRCSSGHVNAIDSPLSPFVFSDLTNARTQEAIRPQAVCAQLYGWSSGTGCSGWPAAPALSTRKLEANAGDQAVRTADMPSRRRSRARAHPAARLPPT